MAQGQWKAKNVKPAKYSGRGTPPYGAAVGLPAAVNVQGRVKDALGLIILHRIIGEVHPPAQVPDPKMMGYGAYGYNNRFGKDWSSEPSYRLSMWQGILHTCGAVPVAMVLNQYESALQRRF